MSAHAVSVMRNFYAYQKERFPIVLLGLSLLPALLSSSVVVSAPAGIYTTLLALAASIAYLLHIRIIDEYRDFDHDTAHHRERPIQTGVISRHDLRYVDIAALAVVLFVAFMSTPWASLIACVMLAYSYLAGKEFFLGERLRGHFFLYNAVNLGQMLLMQIFVYTLFSDLIPFQPIVLLHFLFTTSGTIVFEFVRKLKIPGDDGSGKDTYTWHLGFGRAVLLHAGMVSLNAALFWLIISRALSERAMTGTYVLLALGISLIPILIHVVKRKRSSDQIMQLSFLVTYASYNLAIYFIMR